MCSIYQLAPLTLLHSLTQQQSSVHSLTTTKPTTPSNSRSPFTIPTTTPQYCNIEYTSQATQQHGSCFCYIQQNVYCGIQCSSDFITVGAGYDCSNGYIQSNNNSKTACSNNSQQIYTAQMNRFKLKQSHKPSCAAKSHI